MKRIGVLGAGSHSSTNHGPALREYARQHPGQIELAAVCDLDEGRARAYARQFGFAEVYTDLGRMVDGARLDGLVAVTPMERTEELATRVLELGLPLVVEKPPGVGLAGAVALAAAARHTQTPHMVSFNRRFSPALTRARQWMAARGATPQMIVSRMLRCRRTEPFFVRDTGIHAIDAVLSLTGPAQEVATTVRLLARSEARLHEARLAAAGGLVATFLFAPDAGLKEETVELVGEGFRVWVDFGRSAVTVHEGDAVALEWRATPGTEEHELSGSYDETAAFVAALAGRGPWSPTLEDALASMAVAAAIDSGGRSAFGREATR
ncbi:MAG: Gfo/Idh/MocA family oxidoreductase [Gemmatimonadota bacterium]